MPKMINSWNEWDPLKRVIVGRPEGTNVPAPEPAWQYDMPEQGFPLPASGAFPQEMVDAANEQMDYFVSVLEKRGVKVDRPTTHPCMFNKPVSTPDWTQLNCYGANNVRDVFFCHGKYLIETPGCQRSRWYEYLNLRPLFEQYFKEDPEMVFLTAPKPRLTNDCFNKNYYYNYYKVWNDAEKRQRLYNWDFQCTEKDPYWDGADGMRFGKDIFFQCSSVTNRSGMDWLKRMFAEFGIRVHHVQFDSPEDPNKMDDFHPRHIDDVLLPLRPGLCLYCPDTPPRNPETWELFKKNDWELIPTVEPMYDDEAKLSLCQVYGLRWWIHMNTFSIDPKTICTLDREPAFCEQLDKLGFEVIPIPYEKVIPFGGALHCTTLDIYREGTLEDYFPKQIEGY